MNIVSYGGGTNSTALLVECYKRGIQIDLILFADTGGEKPHTYKYLKYFGKWLEDKGLPRITRVQSVNINGTAITLEGYCLQEKQLPSLAYGYKTCSQKHKIAPQDKFINNWQPAKDVWSTGGKITKLIGFDADEHHRIKDYTDNKYIIKYPLVEWDMGRDECEKSITDAGLELPGKSSCFFCPATKVSEIREMSVIYPDLIKRAINMERNADLTTIKGLSRNNSWESIISTSDMFPDIFETPCGCID